MKKWHLIYTIEQYYANNFSFHHEEYENESVALAAWSVALDNEEACNVTLIEGFALKGN